MSSIGTGDELHCAIKFYSLAAAVPLATVEPPPPNAGAQADGNRKRNRGAADESSILRRLRSLLSSFGLSTFGRAMALNWLERELVSADDACVRVRRWVLMLLNGQRRPPGESVDSFQRGCPQLLPQLRARPFWTEAELPWLKQVRAAFPAIKRELLALRRGGAAGSQGFQPYRAPRGGAAGPTTDRSKSTHDATDGIGSVAVSTGQWNVFYLLLHNLDFSSNCKRCPHTMALLGQGNDALPGCTSYHHAFFSVLAPGTHVTPHHGPTNKKLRCHLPLVVPKGARCGLRVGSEEHVVVEGEPFVFDDSFEHEAWNKDNTQSRIVLIFDVWHPDLTPKEVKFLTFLQNTSMRAAKRATSSSASGDGGHDPTSDWSDDNFFSVIDAARSVPVDASAIWSSEFNAN